MRLFAIWAVFLICLPALMARPSLGGPIAFPPITSLAECTNVGVTDDPSSCSTSTSSASVTLAPFAGVSASGSYPGNDAIINAGAVANLHYSFAVVGGTAGATVPVDVAFNLSQTTYQNGYAFAEIVVTTNGTSGVAICSSGCTNTNQAYSGVLASQTTVGQINTIILEVEAEGLGLSAVANGGQAFADPYIYIDPSYSGPGGLSIVLSDGVSNASGPAPAPEPNALLLLMPALGALAMCRRRRSTGIA